MCLLRSDELWVYDQFYLWILLESSLKSFMHDLYALVFLLRNFGLVWPTRLIFLDMGRGALWWAQSCGAQSQWQKGTWHAFVSLPLRIKWWSLFILIGFTLSTSCHLCLRHYSILYELNILYACRIAIDVWSNSSRCRQE